MPLTRRQVVNAIAAGAVVPVTVASAEAQEEEDQEFSPDISINPNNLVATIGDRDGDVDPDTVTIYTVDGAEHEFDGAAENDWERGDAFDVGYTHDESRARIEGWHGVIDGVTARKGDEQVSQGNDADSSLEVTCSTWRTPDQPPTEFSVLSEGARKIHSNRGNDDLSEDQRQYGSPGRQLRTVAERDSEIEMRVEFDRDCEPDEERAVRFDCTTVTVEPEELQQGGERIEDVQLRFADETTENPPGTADEADNGAYELPATISGTGDNEGKVLERLHFKVSGGEYTYWNQEADSCTAEDGSNDRGDGEDSSDGTGDDSTGSDSDGGDSTGTSEEESPSQDGGGSGGSSDDGSGDSSNDSGSLLDDDADGGTETPDESEATNVTVNSTDDGTATNDSSVDNGTTTGNASTATNGSTGDENGTGDPNAATGTPSEDQPGMGFLAGLGGLLGVGELARRRLDPDEEE